MRTFIEDIKQRRLWGAILGVVGLASISLAAAPDAPQGGKPHAHLELRFAEEDDGPDDIQVWDTQLDRETLRLQGHTAEVYDACFSPDGATIASGSADQTIRIWDAATGKQQAVLEGHAGGVEELLFSPYGGQLASVDDAGRVIVWDLTTHREVGRHESDGATDLIFAPNGRRLAWLAGEGTAHVWSLDRKQEVIALDEMDQEASVSFAFFSANSQAVVTVCDAHVSVFEAATGGLRGRLPLPEDLMVELATLSPDGRHLATASFVEPKKRRAAGRTEITLWDVATGEQKQRVEWKDDDIEALAFSADGKQLVGLAEDKAKAPLQLDAGLVGSHETQALTNDEMGSLWAQLGRKDAAAAFAAMHALAGSREAIAFLSTKYAPRPAGPAVEPAQVNRWIGELDADAFDVRENAAKSLAKARPGVNELLKQALAGNPSVEVRRRLTDLLEEDTASTLDLSRGVQALELIGSDEARELLFTIAKGKGDPRVKLDAQEAAARLANRTR